jgi:hypothetical protein
LHKSFFSPLETHIELVLGVAITTLSWLIVAYISNPTDTKVLIKFLSITKVPGEGWDTIREKISSEDHFQVNKDLFDFQKAVLTLTGTGRSGH